MTVQPIRSPAWLLSGLTHSVAGELMLAQGRLVFKTPDGRRIFDVALRELSAVTFPWYYFGGGMKLRIGTNTYRVSFARPGNLPEDFRESAAGDIRSARESRAVWKTALTPVLTGR